MRCSNHRITESIKMSVELINSIQTPEIKSDKRKCFRKASELDELLLGAYKS
jgi:hypothetical protein